MLQGSGSVVTGGGLRLNATIGQPAAATLSGGTLTLRVGFWSGGAVATSAPSPRSRNVLHPPSPNPFNPRTSIRFALASRSRTRVDVYDLAGRRVRSLLDTELDAGPHDVVWDGLDSANSPVASGTYLVRMRAVGFAASRKITLVR